MSAPGLFSLKGKTALVTGAAGLVGRQIALALVQAGAKIFLAGRSIEKLENEACALRKQGYDAAALSYDQTREDSILKLRDEVLHRAGRLDILVNNAVGRPMKDWTSPAANFAGSMEVNATGLFMVVRAFGDAMAAQGAGSIINIGSIQGMVGPDFTLYEGLDWGVPPDYFFHKGGLVLLTRFAAAKLGPQGIRVNAVSPGGFFTGQDSAFVKRYNARTFLGRMANQTDLMGVIIFLASDASAYITGTNIPVDGGYTAK
ncbi:MAG TPA: SDR family oxidoreductase [Candidatus Saccharimonadales bacterium]|nr:SDR family oxidoreductase [Candidatus Saccharimonadales bacterium]